MRLTFYGACQGVTGSQYLLEVQGHKLLLECGLFQGPREETYRRNRHPKYPAPEIEAVVISHAHLDHSGNLPRIKVKGFTGEIHCTAATNDLCVHILRDSAHLQQKDLEFVNKIHRRKGLPIFNPLYLPEDVEAVLKQFVSQNYRHPFQPIPGVSVELHEAGHVLGSAQELLELQGNGKTYRLGFTGDLGRFGLPILRDPEILSDLDGLIIESTYGDRLHDSVSEAGDELAEVIGSTAEKSGKVIIPAFALERTQELLYHLALLQEQRRIPMLPIYVDSPLAADVTEVFRNHPDCYDSETRKMLQAGIHPFNFPNLKIIREAEDSMALNDRKDPMIIIAASGMCEGGRIVHHLRNNIENPRNTILIVSFQAEHTLGRRIAERRPEVSIFGEPHKLRARVKILNCFSGHADRNGLLQYMEKLRKSSPRLREVFVVHGEPDQSLPFIETLKSWAAFKVHYPEEGQSFVLR
ncbi:MAG: MBL fold metallo-hydrolase [Calditrichaeota bacterium]|nr:MBL fold metallo-hydrolase [Calditrichota bacterium]